MAMGVAPTLNRAVPQRAIPAVVRIQRTTAIAVTGHGQPFVRPVDANHCSICSGAMTVSAPTMWSC